MLVCNAEVIGGIMEMPCVMMESFRSEPVSPVGLFSKQGVSIEANAFMINHQNRDSGYSYVVEKNI
ncbi:MAG: hypothetical protein APR53_08645 [Methanoculleus sp. SDB]|nr:MAG: hypothetical protein APR53_08645 [Methanoculleus sp. SDB]